MDAPTHEDSAISNSAEFLSEFEKQVALHAETLDLLAK